MMFQFSIFFLFILLVSCSVNKSEYAIVTLATTDHYAFGAIMLHASLDMQPDSEFQFLVLLTSGVSQHARRALRSMNVPFRVIKNREQLMCKPQSTEHGFIERFPATCNKLIVASLVEFQRVLFVDADTIYLRQNHDTIIDLFEDVPDVYIRAVPSPSSAAPGDDEFFPDNENAWRKQTHFADVAAPSTGEKVEKLFQSALFLIKPSDERFELLSQLVDSTPTNAGDLELLNIAFASEFRTDPLVSLPRNFLVQSSSTLRLIEKGKAGKKTYHWQLVDPKTKKTFWKSIYFYDFSGPVDGKPWNILSALMAETRQKQKILTFTSDQIIDSLIETALPPHIVVPFRHWYDLFKLRVEPNCEYCAQFILDLSLAFEARVHPDAEHRLKLAAQLKSNNKVNDNDNNGNDDDEDDDGDNHADNNSNNNNNEADDSSKKETASLHSEL